MTHGAAAGQRAAEWSRSTFSRLPSQPCCPATIIVTWRRIKSAGTTNGRG
jgi:hypothetical protein